MKDPLSGSDWKAQRDVHVDVRVDSAIATASPEAEGSYLRQLLEKQPSCLLRAARDGILLACNDAGLSLLGKDDLAQVLNRPFEEHLAPEHAASWREFADRVWITGAGSSECDLAAAGSAVRRTVMLQAIALRNHPDGIESMLLTVRDTSPIRRLEDSLHDERTPVALPAEHAARLEAAEREQQQLTVLLEETRAEQTRLLTSLHARDAERDRTSEEHHHLEAALHEARALAQTQLAEALAGRDAEQQRLADTVAGLEAEHKRLTDVLTARDAEQQGLVDALSARDVERQHLLEAHRAELIRFGDLAGQRQFALMEKSREMGDRIVALENQLTAALAEQQRLTTLLEEYRASGDKVQVSAEERRQQIAALCVRLDELERAHDGIVAERDQAVAARTVAEAACAAAKATRATAEAAREAVERALEEAIAAARDQAATLEERHRAEREALQAAHAAAVDERGRAAELADQLTADLRGATSEHEAARSKMARELEQVRAEAAAQRERDGERFTAAETRFSALRAAAREQTAELEARHQSELENLRAELAQAVADRERAAHAVEHLGEGLRRVAAEHEAQSARLAGDLEDVRAEAAGQLEANRQAVTALEAELAFARAEAKVKEAALEVRSEFEALKTVHAETIAERERTAHLVEQLTAEHERLLRILDQNESERRRLEADRVATRAAIEKQLAEEAERAMAARDRQQEEAVAKLQAELALALADQKRLQMLLGPAEAERQRLVASHAAARIEAERALGKLAASENQAVKALADQRVELDHWRDTACTLELLATTGRLAIHLSRDLNELTARLDDRAQLLLSLSRVDVSYRPIIEAMHADALRAASLARQLSRSSPDPDPASEPQ